MTYSNLISIPDGISLRGVIWSCTRDFDCIRGSDIKPICPHIIYNMRSLSMVHINIIICTDIIYIRKYNRKRRVSCSSIFCNLITPFIQCYLDCSFTMTTSSLQPSWHHITRKLIKYYVSCVPLHNINFVHVILIY